MFSQTLEYALRAAVCMGQHYPTPMTTQQISELTQVPPNYLSKVLQVLGKAELIVATRGLGGGYVLSLPPHELAILQIVNAIDPLKRIKSCPLGIKTHGSRLCPLHYRLDRVLEDAEAMFRRTTIAELLGEASHSTPLCEQRAVPVALGIK